jgi:hypothetical protein
LEIAAAHPEGNNFVRVAGRGRYNQVYSRRLSRDYAGVSDNLPNQWLRVRRVGNAFAFFVSKDGQSWSLIAEQYQSLPQTLLVGTFAASDNPDFTSTVSAEFADYGDTSVADTTAPTLVSVGTLDNKTIGVKFSEPVDSLSATRIENYNLSSGAILNQRQHGVPERHGADGQFVRCDGDRWRGGSRGQSGRPRFARLGYEVRLDLHGHRLHPGSGQSSDAGR